MSKHMGQCERATVPLNLILGDFFLTATGHLSSENIKIQKYHHTKLYRQDIELQTVLLYREHIHRLYSTVQTVEAVILIDCSVLVVKRSSPAVPTCGYDV